MEKARAALEPYDEEWTEIGITEPLTTLPTGKTVHFIECGVENCKLLGDALARAMESLGVADFTRIDAGNTPESFSAAFDESVQRRPDGVLVPAISSEIFAEQLGQYGNMGTSVVSWSVTDEPSGALKAVYMSPPVFEELGTSMANWIIADSNGSANILYLDVSIYDFAGPSLEGMNAGLEENCAECTIDVIKVQPDDFGTNIPARVVSYLQENPDTYITGTFGAVVVGVPEAIAAAGLSGNARIATMNGVDLNYAYLKDDLQLVDLTIPLDLLSWRVADGLARSMVGDEAGLDSIDDSELRWFEIVTPDDVTWDVGREPYPGVRDMESQFIELWGGTGE